ncbi:MAG: hypothetical protein HXS53_10405 [Theionarchaea archaeon]|nr:hypothetical protein [Theionarchaea archaeon]
MCMRKMCIGILAIVCMGIFTGCIGQEESFMLTDIIFCTDEPSNRSYEQNFEHRYVRGDILWVYLECFRFEPMVDNGTYVAVFDATLEIFDDVGTCIESGSQVIEVPTTAHPGYVWLKFWISTDTMEEGTYTLKITVKDTVSHEQATSQGEYFITA